MKTVRLIITLIALLSVGEMFAVPAKGEQFTYTQEDGSKINLRLVGDEFSSFYLTDDDVMVVRGDNNFYFAELDNNGKLKASKVKAANPQNRTSAQKAFVNSVNRNQLAQAAAQASESSPLRVGPSRAVAIPTGVGKLPKCNFPTTGSPRVLVILVEYQDVKFETPVSYFYDMLTKRGFNEEGATGSAADYFYDASNGAFTPQFDIYGVITLPNDRAYYGAVNGSSNDVRPQKMAVDACKILDDQIDFTEYDADGDGDIDNVYIFYAGQGQNYGGVSSDAIWPHAWYVYSGARETCRLDGKRLNHYACSNEVMGLTTRPEGIGTFVHEMSHIFGLPDMYDTSYGAARPLTPGVYDVMDTGSYNNDGRTPPTYSVFERNAMGWCDLKQITGEGETITLDHILTSNQGCIITTASYNEFFLIENRQNSSWDAYIPGHGLLVWHIAFNATYWTNNKPNNNASKMLIDIEEACGSANNYDTDFMSGYTFPGTSGVTEITDDTTPSMRVWSGSGLSTPITSIRELADGSVKFDVCGGSDTVILPPTYNFEGFNMFAFEPFTLELTPENSEDTVYYDIEYVDGSSDYGIYSQPVVVDRNATVSIWSKRDNMRSETTDLYFTFFTQEPTLTDGGTFSYLPDIFMFTETENAEIRYTTDGSDPTEDSDLYTEALKLENRSVTVKAKAFRSGWMASAVVSVDYEVENAEPEIPDFTVTPTYISYADDQTATLHCEVEHYNAEDVDHYEIWVVEKGSTTRYSVRAKVAANETVVGYTEVGGMDIKGETFGVDIVLDGIAPDTGIHRVSVRSQAVLKDGFVYDPTEFSTYSMLPDEDDADSEIFIDSSASGTLTGVTDAMVEQSPDSAVQYFTLSGVEVKGEPAPGVYIHRCGNHTEKVIIK